MIIKYILNIICMPQKKKKDLARFAVKPAWPVGKPATLVGS